MNGLDDADNSEENAGIYLPPRDYQTELFDIVRTGNSILYLPTGSGKTYIAVMLMRSLASQLNKSDPDRKWVIFIVNTVALAEQQAKNIRKYTGLDVQHFTGALNVDIWSPKKWKDIIDANQVLVMVAQVAVNALCHNYIKIEQFNLIIVDECHHTRKNHPMMQVLNYYHCSDIPEKPLILGLTAVLVDGSVSGSLLEEKVADLEDVYKAPVITAKDWKVVREHSTNPQEVCLYYEVQTDEEVLSLFTEPNVVRSFPTSDNVIKPGPDYTLINNSPRNTRNRLLRIYMDIQEITKDMGAAGAIYAIYRGRVEANKIRFTTNSEMIKEIAEYVDNHLTSMQNDLFVLLVQKKYFVGSTIKPSPHRLVLDNMSPKVYHLINLLRCIEKDTACLIFVERRITASVLYFLLMFVSRHADMLPHVSADYIVGGCGPYRVETVESSYMRRRTAASLRKFNRGETNVLVATDILEEGIDIVNCNLVIKFDESKTYTKYVQSKGRARSSSSFCVHLLPDTYVKEPRKNRLDPVCPGNYGSVATLMELLVMRKGSSTVFMNSLEDDGSAEGSGCIYRTDVTAVRGANAISLLNMYVSCLYSEDLIPPIALWWVKPSEGGFICMLQLPAASPVKQLIEGEPCVSKFEAKVKTALKAVEFLHKIGELTDNLLPKRRIKDEEVEEKDDTDWFPNWDMSEDKMTPKAGAKSKIRVVPIKEANNLKNCKIKPHQIVYLHVINFTRERRHCELDPGKEAFWENFLSTDTYGIITEKPMPQISEMPLRSPVYSFVVKIDVCKNLLTLSENELRKLQEFYFSVFDSVLDTVQKFLVYDPQNSPFVVPLTLSEGGEYEINWKAVENINNTMTLVPENFSAEKLRPRYKGCIARKSYDLRREYFIVDVAKTNALEYFKEREMTYAEYYSQRHGVHLKRPELSMLIAIELPHSSLTYVGKSEKVVKKREHPILLPPGVLRVSQFPLSYYVKSLCLPSVLHRVNYLLLARTLNQSICSAGNFISSEQVSILPGDDGNSRCCEVTKEDNQMIVEDSNDFSEEKKAVCNDDVNINGYSSLAGPFKDFVDIDTELIAEIDDISKYNDALSTMVDINADIISPKNSVPKVLENPPVVNILRPTANSGKFVSPGPEIILQSLTTAGCDDMFNYERLETLGDSFLKFSVSLMLCLKYKKKDEGWLSRMKDRIVGNRNLFYCGRKLDLPSYIKTLKFFPKINWIPPGFGVPQFILDYIKQDMCAKSIFSCDIPLEERRTGKLEEDTVTLISSRLKESIGENSSAENSPANFLPFLMMQKIPDKVVSDCVEALIGAYVKNIGIAGGVSFLKFIGILGSTFKDYKDVAKLQYDSANFPLRDVVTLLPEYKKIEETLGYSFRNKSLLLQAFTHPSYTSFIVNAGSYQRLEFLGDAIIDFLVTCYIYEYCGDISPGMLTDLRSALVNNVTFACLIVRNGFHPYILYKSEKLFSEISRFVTYQEACGHVVNDQILFVTNEQAAVNSKNVASELKVPKVLGDVFEAIAAAIYIDSDKNIETVWKVYYNLMKREINIFKKNIPINPIRAMHEMYSCIKKRRGTVTIKGVTLQAVAVDVTIGGKQQTYCGYASDRKTALRAAAKAVIRATEEHSKN